MTDPALYLRASQAGARVQGTSGNVLAFDAQGRVRGIPAAAGGVSSWNARLGAVLPALNDYAASLINNDSSVVGATVRAALNTLLASIAALTSTNIANASTVPGATVTDALGRMSGDTPLDTGPGLIDASSTVATTRRHVMLAGTATAIRTKTLTPGAAGTGFLIEIGTQAFNVLCVNGGPSSGGLFTHTTTAGAREAQFWVSDGTDVSLCVALPLGAEPAI